MTEPAAAPEPQAREIDVQTAHDRVDLPQQYGNWRDYAFSDPHDDDSL